MTDKNYETMRDQVFENLSKLETTDLFDTVNDIIFNIASSNRFYSNVYAGFYKELLDKDISTDKFAQLLQKELTNYFDRFLSIKVVDPSEDYEAFCESNKENERRKALTEFFVHLMVLKVIDPSDISNIHNKLCDLTLEHKFEEEHKQTIIEISENIFIVVKNRRSTF